MIVATRLKQPVHFSLIRRWDYLNRHSVAARLKSGPTAANVINPTNVTNPINLTNPINPFNPTNLIDPTNPFKPLSC
jgi:hypothetical protein